MKIIKNPEKLGWNLIAERPKIEKENLSKLVSNIFYEVENEGEIALSKYTFIYDHVHVNDFLVSKQEIENASNSVSSELKEAIEIAKNNIEKFHKSQIDTSKKIKTSKGVTCWRENRAIEKVGIYIPGGTAPLFSTVLMLGIPAKIAGCNEIILCSAPDKNGQINPAILYTANLIGISSIFIVGGIQAIAALTFGTKSIPKVFKIFGPGNQYVTAAKQYSLNFGLAIDMPAGPSELLIIADSSSIPKFIAADLLSQAEHGLDSQVILLSDSEKVIKDILTEIEIQLPLLPRKEIALAALKNSKSIIFENISECLEFSNLYAPEHLILAVRKSEKLVKGIVNAGSVFLGNYSCESAGDYASGTNHTLPTNGYAKNYSGVALDSFVKKITFQKITKKGIKKIGPAIELMAEAEGLFAHKNAVSVRLKSIIKLVE